MNDRFPNARLRIRWASLFGLESAGVMQLRGNGTFILTDSEIFFLQWVIRKEFHIPLTAITGIETPRSFLGKTRFKPLLKVVFTDESGKTDAIAWDLPNMESVKSQIESLMEKKKRS